MKARSLFRIAPLGAGAFMAAALTLSSGCGKKAAAPPPMTALPVVCTQATSMDFPVFISTFGSLTASSSVDIKAQVGGKIAEARFVEGQEVKAGDVLFVIEKAPFEASLAKAKGDLAQDKAGLEYAEFMVNINKDLANKTVLAAQTYRKYLSDADLERGRILSDKALIETATINLGYCEIVSPISGITGKRLVDPGNIVATSSNPTLVNIRSLDPIYADFSLPEKYFPQVKAHLDKGQVKIIAKPQGDPKEYEGVVTLIDNSMDSSSGTLSLRATIKNKERSLWPGQFVNIKVVLSVLKDATLVPVDAIQNGKEGAFVYVMRDGKAEYVPVTTGQSDVDRTVILKGDVKPGDKVINVGTILLRPGAPVIEAQNAMKMLAEMSAAKGPPPGAAKPGAGKDAPKAEAPAKAKEQGK